MVDFIFEMESSSEAAKVHSEKKDSQAGQNVERVKKAEGRGAGNESDKNKKRCVARFEKETSEAAVTWVIRVR
jgi:hypothetical protein